MRFQNLCLGMGMLIVGYSVAAAQVDRALTRDQLAKIERGGRVMVSENRVGSPWPAITVYAWVAASPARAASVFTDYGGHASYIPELKRSRISRVIDSVTTDVDYTLNVPVVRDEEYTVRNHISRDTTGAIRVDWTLVRATSTRATVGHARFTPHTNARTGSAGTLIEYYNFVTPGSRLAALGFIRSRAVSQVEETVRSIVNRIATAGAR